MRADIFFLVKRGFNHHFRCLNHAVKLRFLAAVYIVPVKILQNTPHSLKRVQQPVNFPYRA